MLESVPHRSYKLATDAFSGKPVKAEAVQELKEEIPAYYATKELVDVVEYARILKRPLLVRGEPGTGKTRLAQAIAYELYKDNYREKYFEWFIKSTTKVDEGLYKFDHLERLRDVQRNERKEIFAYRKFGPLGLAFLASTPGSPAVLLIDEIDKADIDFPNDLLLELDQKRFVIPETSEEIVAAEAPIIIITSNDEKDLPNAFLRRCIFHYIDFPGEEHLLRIITAQARKLERESKKMLPLEILELIVRRFTLLYERMKADPNTNKRPSTSELLDWVTLIHYYYVDHDELEPKDISSGLLYPEVLLKNLDDYKVQTNFPKQ